MDNVYLKEKEDGIGFGIASLVLGIMSLCVWLFLINYIFAIIAIVFGIIQIVSSKRRGMAIAGIIIAGVGIIISCEFWFLIITNNVNIKSNDSKKTNLQVMISPVVSLNGMENYTSHHLI